MKLYEQLLEMINAEVSFGYSTIHVYRAAELATGQVGYSVSPEGDILSGNGEGDWRDTWIVIGYDEILGDPIFIDTAEDTYPVYTAMHGEGYWAPERIAVSLEAFGHSLDAVAAVAKGREHPVALQEHPLLKSEKDELLATIRRYNPKLDLGFWENFVTNV
jgi:hypothetical protein